MPAFLASASGILGLCLLIASPAFHWFGVPTGHMRNGIVAVATAEPHVTYLYKLLCASVAAGLPLLRYRRVPLPSVASVATLLLVALLFFPYFVMTWSPRISAEAGWLQTQHENLSWLGGDIYNEQEYKDIGWKSQLYVGDTERLVGVFRLPNWAPHMIQLGRLQDLLEWLGYSNRFCEFVCKGWFAALAGATLIIISLCRGHAGLRYPVARAIGVTGLASGLAATALALAPPLISGYLMMMARHAVHRGDHEAALVWLERSAKVLPAVRQDTYFTVQKGLLDRALGLDTLEARLHGAAILSQQGFTSRAREEYEALILATTDNSPLRREAMRGLLRMGIDELNSGRAALALATFSEVLDREPCNLKALYAAQIAALRTGDFAMLREDAQRTIEIYKRFNTLTAAPILAACRENLAAADFREQNLAGALVLRRQAIGWRR